MGRGRGTAWMRGAAAAVLAMAGAHSVSVHRQKELLKDGRLSCDYQASFAIN